MLWERILVQKVAGPTCKPEDDYVAWICNAEAQADNIAREATVPCWLEEHLGQKRTWAGKLARMGPDRFACRAALWRDAGRVSRWEHKMEKFVACKPHSRDAKQL